MLVGADGRDTLRGRAGDDVLLGDGGNDYLKGLTGRDIIYAGAGTDSTFGNGGDDLIIGGTLTPDDELTVLEHLTGDLRTEWLSSRTYEQRAENIRGQYLRGSNHSNQNVFGDNNADSLAGGNNADWFFSQLGSDLLDDETDEIVEPF